MAILVPSNVFSDVYKIEVVDPVKGGSVSGSITAPTDGHVNAPLQALANRTEYLFQRMMPVGAIIMWAGAFPPTGWLRCAGGAVSRTVYDDLFSAIGTTFGQGNASTTFDLPDFRGRAPRATDRGAGLDPDAGSRTAMNTGGLAGDNIGSIQQDEIKSHSHEMPNGGTGANTEIDTQTLQNSSNSIPTESTGGSETRMKNFNVDFIIKYI